MSEPSLVQMILIMFIKEAKWLVPALGLSPLSWPWLQYEFQGPLKPTMGKIKKKISR